MGKFTLEIDYREKCLKEYFEQKSYCNIVNLTLGDIILKYDNNIILLIERKTAADLAASIRDGRHNEHKYRLLNPPTKITKFANIKSKLKLSIK